MFVKVCGITHEDDALLAVALGADALGFVFAPSRRQVRPDQAAEIVRRLPHGVVTVGVFSDERPERIVEIVNRLGLTGAQLHGREPLSEVRWVRKRVSFVIQGFAAGDPAVTAAANGPADVVLIDSPHPGSGRVFDWSLAEGAPGGARLLLAGGLNPENVGEAIRRVRPWGVDVSSGVEAAPGRKDPRKLRRFLEEAKATGEELAAKMTATVASRSPFPNRRADRPYDWAEDEALDA
ncbi:MAG: phosphoribosylanthranilate isomerase [Actinobacteria bacterium]|nr:phosphoribosylanthranilate isomerase [Actinomycetota bacterium]